MKILFAISVTLIVAFSAFGQPGEHMTDQQYNDQVGGQLESLIRQSDRDLKFVGDRKRALERTRLRQPLQVEINAPADKVGSLLVNSLASKGYDIETQSKGRFVVSRQLEDFKNSGARLPVAALPRDKEPRISMATVVDEISATKALVRFRLLPTYDSGKIIAPDYKKIKKMRSDVESILSEIRRQAETK